MARRRVTQTMLARELKLSQVAVSRRLAGKVEWSAAELEIVCEVLGISLTIGARAVAS